MTFTDRREATWRWLGIAPPIVVLSICLSAVGGLASWTWVLAAEVRGQKAMSAVAVEKAAAAVLSTSAVEARLARMEDKLDRLVETTADLRAVQTVQPRSRLVDKESE